MMTEAAGETHVFVHSICIQPPAQTTPKRRLAQEFDHPVGHGAPYQTQFDHATSYQCHARDAAGFSSTAVP